MLNERPVTLPHVSMLDGRSAGSAKIAQKSDKKTEKKSAAIDGAVIVYGRDDAGKAHASRFDREQKEPAIRAAHVMGFHAVTASQPAMKAIAEDLPEGRIFESGKAFVPFVKAGVCIALEGHAKQFPKDVLALSAKQVVELEKERSSADGNGVGNVDKGTKQGDVTNNSAQAIPTDPKGKSGLAPDASPDEWQSIKTGDCVLASDEPDDGWWEAIVQNIAPSSAMGGSTMGGNSTSGKDFLILTLKWRDFPEDDEFTRKANQVALLHPAYVPHHEDPHAYAKAKAKR